MLDFETFLNNNGVDVKHSGKNIWSSNNYFGVCCPECDDSQYHFNVKADGSSAFCFRCSTTIKTPEKIGLKLTELSYNEIKDTLLKYEIDGELPAQNSGFEPSTKFETLYNGFSILTDDKKYKKYHKYLINRGFDQIWNKTELRIGKGDYQYRIIIPVNVLENNKLKTVNFIGRTISKYNDMRYKNCPKETVLKPINSCLYGLAESISGFNKKLKYIVLVEGSFDAMNLIFNGSIPAFSLSKMKISNEQIETLINSISRKTSIFTLLDNTTFKKDRKMITDKLNVFFPNVKTIKIPNIYKDPAEIGIKELDKMRKILVNYV